MGLHLAVNIHPQDIHLAIQHIHPDHTQTIPRYHSYKTCTALRKHPDNNQIPQDNIQTSRSQHPGSIQTTFRYHPGSTKQHLDSTQNKSDNIETAFRQHPLVSCASGFMTAGVVPKRLGDR